VTRWGIVGTGGIASTFAADLELLDDARVVAVGSRSQEKAQEFATRFSVAHRHASYEALAEDPDVDAVYVSTPHPMHHSAAMLALRAGKAVLVEKPFTVNAAEADELIAEARARNVFLMEAMWTRFLPHMARIRELLAEGALGDLRTVTADHGQWFVLDAEHRLFAPTLAGGALLDLGVYPLSFASMVFGAPSQVTAVSEAAFTGVDGQTSMLLQYELGGQSVLTTTLEAASPNRAAIVGTEARIEIDRTWYAPTTFTLTSREGKVLERFDAPVAGKGIRFEAAEVARCMGKGLTESPLLPLDETRSIMATMDEVRRQIGLTYPWETS
jgi:predicted dehydrogenase